MPGASICRDLGSKPCLGHSEAHLQISQAKFDSSFPKILTVSLLLFAKHVTSALKTHLTHMYFHQTATSRWHNGPPLLTGGPGQNQQGISHA